MSDAAWLAAVAAAPDDALVRLAYADWLDDHADPRAELLRLDVELAGRVDDDPTAVLLRTRLAELASEADARWRAAVCRVPMAFDGWADDGFCECETAVTLAPGVFATDPGGQHYLVRQPAGPDEVAAVCEAAFGCPELAIRYLGTDPVVIRRLGNDPIYCDHLIRDDSPAVQPAPSPPPLPPPGDSPWLTVTANAPPPAESQTPWWLILLGGSVALRMLAALIRNWG